MSIGEIFEKSANKAGWHGNIEQQRGKKSLFVRTSAFKYMSKPMSKKYQNFAEFYPFYLSQHKNAACRRLHFFGSLLIVALLFYIVFWNKWVLLLLIPVIGYGFAWVGHFFFEKNRPATFTYPVYSLIGDWVMFKDMLVGKIKF